MLSLLLLPSYFTKICFRLRGTIWLFLFVLVLASCSANARHSVGRLDTPEHHVLRGNDAIEEGNWKRAEREFELALGLDEDFATALAGLAVVKAYAINDPLLSKRQRSRSVEQYQDLLDEAFDQADGRKEKREVSLVSIRVYRISKEKKWLKKAESQYSNVIKLNSKDGSDRGDARPYLYMARVRRDAFQLPQAEELYRLVLEQDSPLNGVADVELAVVQKIRRAAPGSRYGKLIAFDEKITRADIAALFISELNLKRLYLRGARVAQFKPSGANNSAPALPSDVVNHPLRSDIEEVIALGVKGLEVSDRGRFLPNEEVTRAEFSLMVEDILIKVTGENDLSTRFVGQNSPFADVGSDLPYFNAVQTVVSRSLMEPKDKINGIFAPLEQITPAEALIVLRLLKNELRSYVR